MDPPRARAGLKLSIPAGEEGRREGGAGLWVGPAPWTPVLLFSRLHGGWRSGFRCCDDPGAQWLSAAGGDPPSLGPAARGAWWVLCSRSRARGCPEAAGPLAGAPEVGSRSSPWSAEAPPAREAPPTEAPPPAARWRRPPTPGEPPRPSRGATGYRLLR